MFHWFCHVRCDLVPISFPCASICSIIVIVLAPLMILYYQASPTGSLLKCCTFTALSELGGLKSSGDSGVKQNLSDTTLRAGRKTTVKLGH